MTAPDPRLNEIQARRSSEPCDRHDWCAISDIAYLLAELRKAHEALERVEELHEPIEGTDGRIKGPICAECSDPEDSMYYFHPCPTVDAIRAAVAAAKGDERG